MNLQDFLVPYIISNLFSLALIFICYKWHKAGKIVWGIIFFAAGAFNVITATSDPHIYVEAYGPSAVLPFYRDFIYGVFSRNAALFVTLIGLGQIVSGLLLFMKNKHFIYGIWGGIIFLTAIMPLGLGSAFPSTFFMAVSLILLYRNREMLTG